MKNTWMMASLLVFLLKSQALGVQKEDIREEVLQKGGLSYMLESDEITPLHQKGKNNSCLSFPLTINITSASHILFRAYTWIEVDLAAVMENLAVNKQKDKVDYSSSSHNKGSSWISNILFKKRNYKAKNKKITINKELLLNVFLVVANSIETHDFNILKIQGNLYPHTEAILENFRRHFREIKGISFLNTNGVIDNTVDELTLNFIQELRTQKGFVLEFNV